MAHGAALMRPLDPDADAEALHGILGDPESCRYLSRPATADVDETRALLRAWHIGTEHTSWAILDGPVVAGRLSMIPREPGVWEVAVMLLPRARGRGLGVQAVIEGTATLFARRDTRRVFADIDPDNLACIALFERAGFAREGLLRATWLTHIGVRDSVVMGRVRADLQR